ncbi:MAG: PulJ/GspJ family protein [Thermus aquaticus]|uniref:PulJ/GspJ family protein n=1 Tax=Thermus aquaticus TaxID=271 RepID=UPI003BFCA402
MRRGLTLLEILVALAVLAIFTTALLAFTQGTLTANRVAQKQAQLLEELKDAAGYLADTLQGGQRVLSSATVNGRGCQPPTCLAVLLPEGGACALRAYRLEARSAVGDDYKSPDPWADANTRMLREYRLGGQSCSATTFSGAQPYVVLDLVDNDNNLAFFQVQTSPTAITLNIRLKAREGGRILFVPGAGQTYSLRVYPRNAP